jgi:ribose 5-phosphate isomerase A
MHTDAKRKAGYAAAELIENGMTVGLGSGSTASFFIERLAERCREGLRVSAAASSHSSLQQARAGGIPLLDPQDAIHLDVTVDGADEIDAFKRMIKGRGGALVRERILASMSKEMIVVVDESKLAPLLGASPLPVEIIPFGRAFTLHKLENLGYKGTVRIAPNGGPFVTDNGNWIIDIHFDAPRKDPERDHERILNVPGVVDTGFFFHLAGRVIIGFFDGQIVTRE